MKKVFSLFLILVFCFSLTACFGMNSEQGKEPQDTYTIEDLGREYEDEILSHAKLLAGDLRCTLEIVVLSKNETLVQLQNYVISENIDLENVVSGLFVKVNVQDDAGEILTTFYYNYGLEFEVEQTKDVGFSFKGSDEVWLLEVVEKNNKLLFEYSIL